MTPAESEKVLNWYEAHKETILAHTNGEKIEFYDRSAKTWLDVWSGPEWDRRVAYRVKPQPTLRPYTDAELERQIGNAFVRKANGDIHLASRYSAACRTVLLCDYGAVDSVTFLLDFTRVDGSPCGVTE